MTQPAQPPPAQPPQPSLEERAQQQQYIAKVAEAVMMVVGNLDPTLTVYALTSIIVTAVQSTAITREQFIDLITQSFDRTRAAMTALGVQPGQPPPADFKERVERYAQQVQAAQAGGAQPPGSGGANGG
jgi:hypothetical protein